MKERERERKRERERERMKERERERERMKEREKDSQPQRVCLPSMHHNNGPLPIGLLSLNLPPPPCAVLQVGR